MEDKLISTIALNPNAEVRVLIREYKEKLYLDIRKWVLPYTGDEKIPTKSGISILTDYLPELTTALETAKTELAKIEK